MARPSSYTEDIAGTICDRLSAGETLRGICRDEGMPDQTTVFRWIRQNDAFRQQYAQAREIQADNWADEIVEISDDGSNDWMKRNRGEDKVWVENGEAIGRSRLRVEARKWMAGKLRPKKYGDKLALGNDPDNPLPTVTFFALPDNGRD